MKTEKILDTKAESTTCTYCRGDFVQLASRVQSLMSCVMAVNRVERLCSIGCRNHVDDLVVPVVTQLNRIPAILLLHSLPISWIQIYRKKNMCIFSKGKEICYVLLDILKFENQRDHKILCGKLFAIKYLQNKVPLLEIKSWFTVDYFTTLCNFSPK